MSRFSSTRIILLAVATLLLPVALADGDVTDIPEIEGYRSWAFVHGPFEVTHGMEFLCFRPPFAGHPGMEPHQGPDFVARSIWVWGNEAAATVLGAESIEADARFPVGSVIVKQKAQLEDRQAPKVVGVMIKREPGFDKRHDDWEFLTRAADGRVARGPAELPACYRCHKDGSFGGGEKAVDYVFVDRYQSQEALLEALRDLEN